MRLNNAKVQFKNYCNLPGIYGISLRLNIVLLIYYIIYSKVKYIVIEAYFSAALSPRIVILV